MSGQMTNERVGGVTTTWVPEENWRKVNPFLFLRPNSIEPLPQPVPWDVESHVVSPQELLSQLARLPHIKELAPLSQDDAQKLALIVVGPHKAVCWMGPQAQCVSLKSQKEPPHPLQPESPAACLLAQDLVSQCPHALVIQIATSPVTPSIAVFHHPQGGLKTPVVGRTQIHISSNGAADVLVWDTTHANTHSHTQWFLGANAHVRHLWVVAPNASPLEEVGEGPKALIERRVALGANSSFTESQFFNPQGICRINSTITMDAMASTYKGSGVAVASGSTLFDFEPIQEHGAHRTQSHYSLKMLMAGKAHGIFQGLVHIHRHAEECVGSQENKNLLLNPKARADASPRLEISPNAVSCKHGSATGELDEQQIFYLCARGFDYPEAKSMVLRSFIDTQMENTPPTFSQLAYGFLDLRIQEALL